MFTKRTGVAVVRWSALGSLLAVSLVTVLVAGCGSGSSGGSGSGSGSSGTTPSLEGTSWKLTSWSVSSLDPTSFTITAEFKDGRVGGTSAVNQYGGPYTTGPGEAFHVGELVSTMMAGPEPAMRAEKAYLELLAATTTFRVEDGMLTLSGGGGDSLVFSTKE